MTARHNHIGRVLGFRLQQQLPFDQHLVSTNRAYIRFSLTQMYLPDVVVIPRAFIERMKREQPDRLEVYPDPLPLVVEVWSPSTGKEDLTEKLSGYQERGDAKI